MKERCTLVKLNLQFHEDSAIFSVDAIEHNGKTIIATAGGDKAIRLWEYSYTGEPSKEEFEYKTALSEGSEINHIYTLSKHAGSVNALEFSRDKKYLVSAGDGGAVYLWNIEDILLSTPEEEDKKYTGRPVVIRESDNSDIYEVKWFNERTLVGTSSGKVEQYTISLREEKEQEKENKLPVAPENNDKKSLIKIRVIEEYKSELTVKCISSKQAHRDIIQGIACTNNIFATIGNDRVLKIYSETGKVIQKISKKSLITDKHTLFFRRLSFSSNGDLYLPSSTHEGKNSVHILSPPEYKVRKSIETFPSSTVCTHSTSKFLVVSEGRNIYLFENTEYTLIFRISDCAFLPITDIISISDKENYLSLIVSSSDGFLSNLIVYGL